tara:strand:+ start:1568 stop:1891 length:324 start_codon:yes stop_codon:yes gene_type:complete
MRKIEQLMNNSIRNRQDFCYSNTMVTHNDGDAYVYLHGNHIATVGDTFLTIYDGGWQSNTTKSRLNALINEFCNAYTDGVFQQNWDWFINTADGVQDFVNGFTFGGK